VSRNAQPMTAAQRRMRASIAGSTRWANSTREEREAQGAIARRNSPADLDYWARRLDPNGQLDDDERLRRAELARRVHYQRLAFRSSRARAARKAAAGDAA
jgi:hypothetical protein